MSLPNLLTVSHFTQRYPAFPPGGLRYWIFNAEKNGLAPALRRVGRKVLIDEAAFFDWIEKQNAQRVSK